MADQKSTGERSADADILARMLQQEFKAFEPQYGEGVVFLGSGTSRVIFLLPTILQNPYAKKSFRDGIVTQAKIKKVSSNFYNPSLFFMAQ